ncbi:MAG: hypothetical protein IIT47_05220, partial [Oscillospiraceae bacterium]|nr:hypothetical protein [Oscillospiraceae bacterium]
ATLKVFFEPEDDVISINDKIEKTIEENQDSSFDNATDKFANFMFSIPLLPRIVVGLARFLDYIGLLPRAIIDLSPFHTSLFITNLASINLDEIYHHCYQFGTTGVFACMGRPTANFRTGEFDKRVMPLSFVMDERICTGIEYARFCSSFMHYLKHPEQLENSTKTEETAKEAAAV